MNKPRPPSHARIRHPDTLGPEEETRVPCPCCGKGLVSPTIAALVREALKGLPEPLPTLVTEIRPTVPEK